MKVLWIKNGLFEQHRVMLGQDASRVTGGSWMNAAYQSSLGIEGLQLHIATVSKVKERMVSKCDGNCFYILPFNGGDEYDINNKANIKEWEWLRQEVQPDVVVVWGTETRFAYTAVKAMRGLPIVIFVQGIISSIFKHFYDAIPRQYQNVTFRDFIDRFSRSSVVNNFKRQIPLEQEMLQMAAAVIGENDWAEDVCKTINSELQYYKCLLPIRDIYKSKEWSIKNVRRHTVFTNAGGYPIKGHHILFEALAIVKKQYPDVKCYVPGDPLQSYQNIKRRTGYIKLLEDIIREKGLQDSVIYTGSLSSEQMVEQLSNSHVYVMPSVIENHSSSLIEAMFVGVPSISSLVGGTSSYVRQKQNAILFNSLDAESLAGYIIRVFDDDNFANSLSKNALKLREERNQNFGDTMQSIYLSVINHSNNQK